MKPNAVIADGAPNTKPVHTRDELVNEIAAVGLDIFDTEDERTKAMKGFNSKLKDLKKRWRELAMTVKTSGIRDSIQTNFGSVIAAREPGDDDESDN